MDGRLDGQTDVLVKNLRLIIIVMFSKHFDEILGGKFSNLSRLTHSLTHSLTHWFSQGYIFIGRFSKRGLQLPLREIVLMLKLAIDLKIRPIKV